jgi:flagellar FliJ protein
MAKKYKFKLEAVLKMRKIREDQCKMEIGRIQVEIGKINAQIDEQNAGISEAYELQELSLKDGSTGQESRFHPYFVSGKRSHIESLQVSLRELEERVAKMYRILTQFRADVKLIEKMKEKDQKKFKKARDKKINENLEEQSQMLRQILKG